MNGWYFEPLFLTDKEYKIKGGFGWSVDFYLSKDGDISIKNIEKGPYMRKQPIVKIISSGQSWAKQKRIRIMMPELIKVSLSIPFEYGNYKLDVFEGNFRGENIFEFPEGVYEFNGEDGLGFKIFVEKDNISISDIQKGKFIFDEKKISIKKENSLFKFEFPLPLNVYSIDFDIPFYLYPIETKKYYLEGEYKLKGKIGWEIDFKINGNGINIIKVEKGPILNELKCKVDGFKIYLSTDDFKYVSFTTGKNENYEISNFLSTWEMNSYYIFDDDLKIANLSLPEGKYRFGNYEFEINKSKFNSISFMKNRGMKIEIDDNYWISKKNVKFLGELKGNFESPFLTIWAKKYNENWENSRKIYEGKFEKEIEFTLPELQFENYTLRFNLKDKEFSKGPNDYLVCCEIPYFPIVSDGYNLYIYTKNNQTYFYQGMPIEFSVSIKKFGKKIKENFLYIILSNGEKEEILRKIDISKINVSEKLNCKIETEDLKPGDYNLIAKIGNSFDKVDIEIVDSIPETNFIIHAYGGEYDEKILQGLSEIGVNTQINNGAISSGWINKKFQNQYDFLIYGKNPYLLPVEKLYKKSVIRKYFEELIKNRIKLIAQYGCAHQFFHYSTCFLDPEIQKTIARDISLYLQIVKDYGVLYGINLGDEAGTPRGPTGWDDHCNICMEIFSRENNIEIPFNIWDIDEWRRWVIKDEIWEKYYYFKQIQMPILMEYVKKECDKVFQLPYHTQGGNLNYFSIDAGYPPISNKPYGFNTAHWYPHYGTTLWNLIGVEFMKMGPNKIPYLPLIWSCDDFYTTRHEIYLCIADGVDGVGHFHIPAALGGTAIKEIDQKKLLKEDTHPKLIKYGDIFKKIRPERKIAVLFSFTQQIQDMKDCYDGEKAVGNYSPAYRQVHRAGMAFLTLWRAGFPSSIISEEDIKNGKLKDFKVLFITGVKNLPKEVIEKIEEFISKEGKVFVDAEAEININGVERLNFDFSKWYWETVGVGEKGSFEKASFVDYPYTIPLIPSIEKILSKYIEKQISTSPFLIVSPFKSGQIKYFVCVNDFQVEFEKRKNPILSEYLPLKTNLNIKEKGFIYDLFEGKEILSENIPIEISPGDMKVFVFLPEKIGKLKTKIEKNNLEVKIFSEKGNLIEGCLPIEISYFDSNGNLVKKIYRATDENGIYKEKLISYLNINYPLKISVKELVSGKENKIILNKKIEGKVSLIIEKGNKKISKEFKEFISKYKNDEILIVYGNEKEKELIEKYLIPYLKKEKIKYKFFNSISLPSKEYPYLLGRGIARTPLGVPYYYYPLNYKIEKPVIIIGTPNSNKVVKEIVKSEVIDFSFCGIGYKLFDWDYDSFLFVSLDYNEIEEILKGRIYEN